MRKRQRHQHELQDEDGGHQWTIRRWPRVYILHFYQKRGDRYDEEEKKEVNVGAVLSVSHPSSPRPLTKLELSLPEEL